MTPTLHVQLLGRFRLSIDDAPVTTLDSPRLQALLAYLLLQRDASHARAHLAFQLWPDTTEAQAHANLRTLLHRLRQALPDTDRFLHVDAQTIQWRGDASATLDVAEFERALAQAAPAEQVGNQDAVRVALREAVEQYGGDLLPALYDDWVLLERERLRQAFLAGLEKLVVLLEQAGEYAAAIGYAQRLLRHDPLHEAAYQHLMRLHARSGDRASAVRIYRTCATVLERELGVEPSPATREAYERLRHVEAQPPPASRSTSLAERDRRHNLPIALTSFIGRTHELAEVGRLLARIRLLTLTGVGGCGKTRLALAAATMVLSEYSDGVWLVELAALTDAALVPQAVATTLGVREEPQRPLTATLLDALRFRDMVLVLDNCEHLIDACAQLAQTLLGACPHLRILATSREALGVAGETTWLVPSLALPDPQLAPALEELAQVEAVQLFVERALAALPTFALTQANAPAVAQICQRLDGIPLAIELAAARIKVLAVEQITTRLDACFRLLTAGSRSALPRHQTLRAAIDWSYVLLSDLERAMFRRLSVFAGGWTLEAAEAVCAGEGVTADEVLELLAHLVDKSLVVVETPDGAVRYRLLETVRQYGWDRLREAGEATAIRQQHAAYYVALAEMIEPKLRGVEQQAWLARLESEHDNLRAALEWSQAAEDGAQLGLRLAGALGWFWMMRGHLSEGRAWLARVLAWPEAVRPTLARAWGLNRAGFLASAQRDEIARALHEESLAISRALQDKAHIAWALSGLGNALREQDDYIQAAGQYEECLALFRELDDTWGCAWALLSLGGLARPQGDHARAGAWYEESLALFRKVGDRWNQARVLRGLGRVARAQGNYAQATKLLEESLVLLRELGDKAGMVRALTRLEEVAQDRGDHARAAVLYQESLTLLRELGDKPRTRQNITPQIDP